MKKVKNILFVCSGNIFRSMTAEYVMKHYLKINSMEGFNVSSAGTHYAPQQMRGEVKEELLKYGINPSKHKQRKLTKKIINDADIVIAMAKNHKEFLKKEFSSKSYLFNKICCGKEESIADVNEAIIDYDANKKESIEYCRQVVKKIISDMPKFIENLNKSLN